MLTGTTFLVKEHVRALKLTDRFDILDTTTGQPLAIAKEEPPGWVTVLRLLMKKQMLPTKVNVYDSDGQLVLFSMHKGFTFLRARLAVRDAQGNLLGNFRSKLFSLGGGFWMHNAKGDQFAEIKGDWKGWNFKFLGPGGRELGTVTKKWAGIGKELFTSADNYIIAIADGVVPNDAVRVLLIAAGLAIDIVFKERR